MSAIEFSIFMICRIFFYEKIRFLCLLLFFLLTKKNNNLL